MCVLAHMYLRLVLAVVQPLRQSSTPNPDEITSLLYNSFDILVTSLTHLLNLCFIQPPSSTKDNRCPSYSNQKEHVKV